MLDKTFETTEERDAYIAVTFPGRKATDVPGHFELGEGRRLIVFQNTIEWDAPVEKFIKVRAEGERQFRFIGSGGREVRTRIHAVIFSPEKVETALGQLRTDNPGFEFKAVDAWRA